MEHAIPANIAALAAFLLFLISPLMMPGGLRRARNVIERTLMPYLVSFCLPAAFVWFLFTLSGLQ